MILIDANILIYAVNQDAPLHSAAQRWLERAIGHGEPLGLAWNVILAFLRLTTRAGLFRNPMPVETAFDLVDAWLSEPSVTIVEPGPQHGRVLRDLLLTAGTAGNLTSDAHLAALAIEHGAELCSSDSDFARFGGLRWRNPLVSSVS